MQRLVRQASSSCKSGALTGATETQLVQVVMSSRTTGDAGAGDVESRLAMFGT